MANAYMDRGLIAELLWIAELGARENNIERPCFFISMLCFWDIVQQGTPLKKVELEILLGGMLVGTPLPACPTRLYTL